MSKIIVEPKTARLYRDLDTFGKMDPYVTIQCGGDKAKSKTHNGGGKNPSWKDALSIKAKDDTMTLTVWDKDVGKDDFVGSTAIDLNKIQMGGGVLKDWISIYHKGKEAGQVYCEITLTSKSSAHGSYGAMPAGYAPAAYPSAGYAPTAYAPAPAATYYPTAPAPAPAPAPAGYYQSSPGVYAPAPAPAPAYPSAYPTAYPSAYPTAPAPAPAPAYPSTYPTAPAPGTPGTYYQAPPSGHGGYYGYQ